MAWIAAVTAAAIVGVVVYPRVSPVMLDRLDPLKGEITAKVKKLGDRVESGVRSLQAPGSARVYVRERAANLRAGPSTDSPVAGVVSRSDRLERLDQRGNWVRIRVVGPNGKEGWVHGSLLSERPGQ